MSRRQAQVTLRRKCAPLRIVASARRCHAHHLSLLKTWFAPRQPFVGTSSPRPSGYARPSRFAKEFGPHQVLRSDRSRRDAATVFSDWDIQSTVRGREPLGPSRENGRGRASLRIWWRRRAPSTTTRSRVPESRATRRICPGLNRS